MARRNFLVITQVIIVDWPQSMAVRSTLQKAQRRMCRTIGRAQVVAVPLFLVMFATIARTASNSDAPEAELPSASRPISVGQPGSQPASVNPLTGLVTVSSVNYRPLSLNERWVLYWKQNYFSAGAYAGPVLTAVLLDQASGTPAQWGGGVEGYGRRLASRLGEADLQGTVPGATRRYFARGCALYLEFPTRIWAPRTARRHL